MQIDPTQYSKTFFAEVEEHLESLEGALLRLEKSPRDLAAINEAFRAAHSIKGGADAVGFPQIAEFTHALEETLARGRREERLESAKVDLLLGATDLLGQLIDTVREEKAPPAGVAGFLARFSDTTFAQTRLPYDVQITPDAHAFRSGLDPLLLLRELAQVTQIEQTQLLSDRLPALAEVDPEVCYLSWHLRVLADRAETIADVFTFARDMVVVEIAPASDGSTCASPTGNRMDSPIGQSAQPNSIRFAQFLVESGRLMAVDALDVLERRLMRRPTLSCLALEMEIITPEMLFEILAQMESGQGFGPIAIKLGYLTEETFAVLLLKQELAAPDFFEVLVETNLLTRDEVAKALVAYQTDAKSAAEVASHFTEESWEGMPSPPDGAVLEENGEMIRDFCNEAGEHLEAADRHLLTLDADPTHAEALNAVYRGFHTIKGVSSMLGLGAVQMLAHEAESLLNLARDGKVLLQGNCMDLVFASTDALKQQLRFIRTWLQERGTLREDALLPNLLTALRRAVNASPEVQANRAPVKKSDAAGAPSPAQSTVALEKAEVQPEVASRRPADKETVRVDKDRLDKLINTIGELVIAQSMAQQEFDELTAGSGVLSLALPELSKISRDLQELSLSLRMVPLQGTFQKMARLVRDLSRKMQKPVNFELVGEETELDKTVVDQLGDPLMHMVRNAIDHGLELPAERIALGKSADGQVQLHAYYQGGNVYIELSDDGKGLDRDRILRKAVEKGIVAEGTRLSDAEIYSLIFAPGFSTAAAVTDVSGRGVGMDVVRRNVEALQGNILIRTQLGKGTTFTIRLPLTLAIMDGLMVGLQDDVYVLPLLSVVESFRPRPSDLHTLAARGEAVTVRGEIVPLLRLNQLLGRLSRVTEPCRGLVVLVEDQGKKHALLVDELLGQMQAVVKSLDANYRRVEGLAGATILGDGRVAMILDIHGLVQLHHQFGRGALLPAITESLHSFEEYA